MVKLGNNKQFTAVTMYTKRYAAVYSGICVLRYAVTIYNSVMIFRFHFGFRLVYVWRCFYMFCPWH